MKKHAVRGNIIFRVVLLSVVFMDIGVPDGPKEKVWEYPVEHKSPIEFFKKYLCEGSMTQQVKKWVEKWYDRLCVDFEEEWRIPKDFPSVVGNPVQFTIYQHFCIALFAMKDGAWIPWYKFPYAFIVRYFQTSIYRFTDVWQLTFNTDKVDCDYHTLRKKYVYVGWGAYVERLIFDVLSIKPISLVVGYIRAVPVYLQLKPNMENKKYVEGDFTLLEPPKGKYIMENILVPKPKEPIEVKDEEEECEDSVILDHRGRRHPMSKD